MRIGGAITSLLTRVLGSADPHSHFRTRPLVEWARRAPLRNSALIIEVGCGSGANIIGLSKIFPADVEFLGFDRDEAAIKTAVAVSEREGLKNVTFLAQDCARFRFERRPDIVLLMDFLEHIPDPIGFLRDIRSLMNDDAILLISVPTPRFPRIFGRQFHEGLGHLVDGYDAVTLRRMLKESGFETTHCSYNTGMIASALCFIHYNVLSKVTGRFKMLIGFFLGVFRFADFFNGPRLSCSLFATARLSERGSSRHAL